MTDNGARTPVQQRRGTTVHEAGHAVASWLLGGSIERVVVRSTAEIEDGVARDTDRAGWVEYAARTGPLTLAETLDEIQVLLAGEAAVRIHVASQPEPVAFAFYGTQFREPTLEELIGTPPVEQAQVAAFDGWRERGGCRDDLKAAEQLTIAVTSSAAEADALLCWLRYRVAAWVVSERFQHLVQALVPQLLAEGEVSGELVDRTLTIADQRFERAAREEEQ